MTKHAKNSPYLQIVDLPKTMAVEIPLPLLGAFANIENSFFELCIDSGQQVLGARWIRHTSREAWAVGGILPQWLGRSGRERRRSDPRLEDASRPSSYAQVSCRSILC